MKIAIRARRETENGDCQYFVTVSEFSLRSAVRRVRTGVSKNACTAGLAATPLQIGGNLFEVRIIRGSFIRAILERMTERMSQCISASDGSPNSYRGRSRFCACIGCRGGSAFAPRALGCGTTAAAPARGRIFRARLDRRFPAAFDRKRQSDLGS